LHAVVTLPELLEIWLRSGDINRTRYEEVKNFLTR